MRQNKIKTKKSSRQNELKTARNKLSLKQSKFETSRNGKAGKVTNDWERSVQIKRALEDLLIILLVLVDSLKRMVEL